MKEKRRHRRILSVCEILDLNHNRLGYTLDLTTQGVRLIIAKSASQEKTINLIIKPDLYSKIAPIKVQIEPKWCREKNHQFDEIGGIFTTVDNPNNLELLLNYFDNIVDYRVILSSLHQVVKMLN
jgi:hypothetical protein